MKLEFGEIFACTNAFTDCINTQSSKDHAMCMKCVGGRTLQCPQFYHFSASIDTFYPRQITNWFIVEQMHKRPIDGLID